MITTKKKKKRSVLKIFFMILALVYFVAFFNWIFDRNIELDIIKQGEVTEKHSTKAVIIRDSYIIRTPHEGQRIYLFSDGQRVRKEAELIYIFAEQFKAQHDRYFLLSDEITNLKRGLTRNIISSGNDLIKLRQQRDAYMLSMYESGNDIKRSALITELIKSVNEGIIDNLYQKAESAADITQKEDEKKSIEQSLINSGSYIKAPESGIFTSNTDGYETQSSRDLIASINTQWINNITANPVGPRKNSEDCGKLVISTYYYLAVIIDEQIKEKLDEKEYVRIIFPQIPEPFYAIKHQIRLDGDDTYILILRTDRYLERLINLRTVNIDILIQNVSGIKVPLTALKKHDNDTADIFISRNGDIIKLGVNIEASDKRHAIISSDELKMSDLLVQNPAKAREGMFIK